MEDETIVAHAKKIVASKPKWVSFTIVLDNVHDSFAMVYLEDYSVERFNLTIREMKIYEEILKNNFVEVEVSFLE